MWLTPSRGQPSLSCNGELPNNNNKNNDCCDADCVVFVDTTHLHATCAAQPEEMTCSTDGLQKTARGCPPLMKADNGSHTHSTTSHQYPQASHRTADASSDLSNRPTQSSGRAMELIRQRRSTVVWRSTDIPAFDHPYEESKRGGSRNVCAVSVVAEKASSGAIHNLMPHARTADQRGGLRGLFDGNIRCGAIVRSAARKDAAVRVANGSNPAGHGDSGVTKDCGAIGNEAGAPLTKEWVDQYIRSRTDWKERVVF
ncbi:hypothetical protein TcCL_Unassigned02580 [Trypanosoma cruzi]|nr:hypothetical protein TcCL_Unassigned02580 [Trypanosoma cruzi]